MKQRMARPGRPMRGWTPVFRGRFMDRPGLVGAGCILPRIRVQCMAPWEAIKGRSDDLQDRSQMNPA